MTDRPGSSTSAPSSLAAVILAAGQGTRMKSKKAKVLHELCGRPMIHHVVGAALSAGVGDVVVVVGFDGESVRASLAGAFGERARTAEQPEQRGTGHAVQCAMPAVPRSSDVVMVLCGDTPLLRASDLAALREAFARDASAPMGMLTCDVPDPTGYGRILRDPDGRVRAIREHRDCSDAERAIHEVNPGVYIVRRAFLDEALGGLRADNAQGELYFTDVVAAACARGGVVAVKADDHASLAGINDRAQLAAAEEVLHARIADDLRRSGVTIRGSARIDAGVVVEPEAVVGPGVVLRGATRVGAGAFVDVGCVLTDVTVAAGAKLQPYTVASRSTIGDRAQIGPFSHLRPDSVIEEEAHVGNFVETKKTTLRKGAKANHLAYLGDGDVGPGANVGAGTIFCNYDGFQKHRTEIGAGAFIGSDSQLVAPVKIGAGAYVGTGTCVTKDVPEGALAIARVPQENKLGYADKLKARLQARSKDRTGSGK
jgi:bifunctional UDP-N-acetylglucosamine pyrophosphorylase/glucosamine-1-phosphate N-acetyltransferase